ncbi:MAG: SusC/RagA family TonB-linked outer membrane protein [Gemmatimonadales bacterium]
MTLSARLRVMLRGLVPILALFGIAGEAAAQATFRGRVANDRGEPIVGASVAITELSLQTITNAQGQYSLVVPAARISGQAVNLVARAIGFKSQTRPIPQLAGGEQTVDFALNTDVNRLEEIVVTGVVEGVERARVPFSVGRITAEELPVPALDPVRALAGKVAGVRIGQTSGRPGSTPEILLRGPTSINANGRGQGPLIIVDDAIMNVGSLEELGGLDIESVEVVKGAAGASLYGTRAASGVITIRTKRGSAGSDGVKFNVRTEYGVSDLNSTNYGQPVNHHLQLDETGTRFCVNVSGNAPCSRTFDWMTEILRINNVNADTTRTPQNVVYNSPSLTDLRNVYQAQIWPGQYYNSLAQVATRNPTILTSVDATGKVGQVSFFVSGSYQDEAGAIRGIDGIQQRRFRVNLDYSPRSDLKVSISTLYDDLTNDLRSGGSSNGSIFGQLLRGAPAGTNYLARDTLGRYLVRGGGAGLRGTGNGGGTFLYDTENLLSYRQSGRFLGSLTARYFPADWVTFEGTFAYDNRNRVDNTTVFKGYRTFTLSTANNNGNIGIGNLDEESLNGSLTATFRKQINSDLNGKLSFRGIYDESTTDANSSGGQIFRVNDVYTLSNTSANSSVGSSSSTIKNVGVFTGATLDYKDGRYVLEGSFRYDGSSLFGAGHRWSPFGRVSGVWNVSREPFWNVGFLDEFRLRASRGTAGSPPPFVAQYETYTVSATGIALGQAGNSQLRPETTTELELGTDFTLFKRLGVEFTYAHGTTKDQILPVGTPNSLGFSTQWKNAGTLVNKTFELALNLPIMNNKNFYWTMRGTWDRNRTYVDELFVPEFIYTGGTAQGTGSFFHITDSREKDANGVPLNRYGNIWGRKFLKSCSELPSAARGDCGSATSSFQVNDEGWLVWVGQGNSWRDGITKNLWGTTLSANDSPYCVPLAFGHPIVDRPACGEPGQGVGINQIIGNVFPDFRFSFANDVQFRRLTLYTLLEASVGNDLNNQGEGWGLLDFSSANFDQGSKTVETAKPVGYGWRAGSPESTGTGGFYDVLGPNNYNVENASFAKIREVSLSYKLGKFAGVGDWTLSLIGRNLMTFTGYSGLDPETGVSGGSTGSGLINQTDAFGFPTLRTFTFSIATRF